MNTPKGPFDDDPMRDATVVRPRGAAPAPVPAVTVTASSNVALPLTVREAVVLPVPAEASTSVVPVTCRAPVSSETSVPAASASTLLTSRSPPTVTAPEKVAPTDWSLVSSLVTVRLPPVRLTVVPVTTSGAPAPVSLVISSAPVVPVMAPSWK